MNAFKPTGNTIFRAALHPSLITGLVAAVLHMVVLTGLFNLAWSHTLIYSCMAGALTAIASYFAIRLLLYRRLKTLQQLLDNLTNHEYRINSPIDPYVRNELDEIIQQTIRASNKVADDLESMNKTENYRKEFIGDISHELKTPIFAIQGFLETLLDGAIDDPGVNRRFLKKTERHVNRLIYLTQDLMEISQLESGKLKSSFQSIYLKDLIMDVVESLTYHAEQKGITLETENLEDDLSVYADRHQIRRVLTNLVDNAIKYNRENGRVIIGVESYAKSRKHKQIRVYVSDTGIGIPEDQMERITERFYRVDKSRSRQKGGTGLGLSIVKHIMEVHGEELFIESTPGEGSTFSFTLTEVHFPSD